MCNGDGKILCVVAWWLKGCGKGCLCLWRGRRVRQSWAAGIALDLYLQDMQRASRRKGIVDLKQNVRVLGGWVERPDTEPCGWRYIRVRIHIVNVLSFRCNSRDRHTVMG